jgi:hypothetical protein
MASVLRMLAGQLTCEEQDFTTVSTSQRNLSPTSQCFDSGEAMDTLDSFSMMSDYEVHTDQIPTSVPPVMYQTGAFTFSDLQELESDVISSGNTSHSTSRSHSYSVPTEGQIPQPSLPSQSEKMCPLLAGQVFHCNPQLCGPDAACLDFSMAPEIEDCVSIPCITRKPSDSFELTQASQPAPISIPSTAPVRPSISQSKKPTRNAQQRPKRANSDDTDTKPHSKKAHSLVERRYRENLNGNIAQLHLALLKTKSVGHATQQNQDDELEERQQALLKVRKSDVMLEAVDYVYQTEVELRHMADEIERLNTRVKQLEKLVNCDDCLLMKQLVNFSL